MTVRLVVAVASCPPLLTVRVKGCGPEPLAVSVWLRAVVLLVAAMEVPCPLVIV